MLLGCWRCLNEVILPAESIYKLCGAGHDQLVHLATHLRGNRLVINDVAVSVVCVDRARLLWVMSVNWSASQSQTFL